MTCFEYMLIKISDIPEEIIEEYNLREIVTEDGYVCCKIRKGMYGLPQAGIIAQELLTESLQNMATIRAKSSRDYGRMK